MVKRIRIEDEHGVPKIIDAPGEDAKEGVVISVEMECQQLPPDIKTAFLQHLGVVMPDEILKPGIHKRVVAALRAAYSDKDRLKRLADNIIRQTKEVYHDE